MGAVEARAGGESRAGAGALIAVFAVVTLALLAVFRGAEWYADQVSIPRYCEDPAAAVRLVQRILSEPRPAGAGATKPYVIAAKLIHLVPRHDGEPSAAYVVRLRREIGRRCP